jgi:hypothetical protein
VVSEKLEYTARTLPLADNGSGDLCLSYAFTSNQHNLGHFHQFVLWHWKTMEKHHFPQPTSNNNILTIFQYRPHWEEELSPPSDRNKEPHSLRYQWRQIRELRFLLPPKPEIEYTPSFAIMVSKQAS